MVVGDSPLCRSHVVCAHPRDSSQFAARKISQSLASLPNKEVIRADGENGSEREASFGAGIEDISDRPQPLNWARKLEAGKRNEGETKTHLLGR